MAFQQKAGAILYEFLRRVGLLVLFCTAPFFLTDCLNEIYYNGSHGIFFVCLWLVGYFGSWAVSRPSHATVSVTLLWTALYYMGAHIASSNHLRVDLDLANIPSAEEAFYAPAYYISGYFALALGIFTAVAGMVRSRRASVTRKS